MKKEYDFSRARKNPYAKRLKKQMTRTRRRRSEAAEDRGRQGARNV